MSISALVLYGRGIHQSRRLSMSMKERMVELEEARARANLGGGAVKNSEQHSRGKMTARERIEALVDLDSFVEIDRYALHQTRDFGMMDKRILGDGVVTGFGRRTNTGRRSQPRGLRRDILPQRFGFRRYPSDQRNHGTMCRRRRILSCNDRLHFNGRRDELHVHYWS